MLHWVQGDTPFLCTDGMNIAAYNLSKVPRKIIDLKDCYPLSVWHMRHLPREIAQLHFERSNLLGASICVHLSHLLGHASSSQRSNPPERKSKIMDLWRRE